MRTAFLVLLLFRLGALAAATPEPMPLGVYWPPNLGFPGMEEKAKWDKVDGVMASLERHHVNTIWLNHGRANLQAEYARRAAKHGIRLVAAISTIHTEQECQRNGYERVERVAPYLVRIVPKDDRLAFHAKGWPGIGDYVRNFVDEGDGTRYVVVVNGNLTESAVIPVNVVKPVHVATDLCSGEELQAIDAYTSHWEPIGTPFRQFRVSLEPGSGTLLKLELTAPQPPKDHKEP